MFKLRIIQYSLTLIMGSCLTPKRRIVLLLFILNTFSKSILLKFHESLALGFNSHEFCIFLIDRIKQYKDYTIPYPVIHPITIFPWNRGNECVDSLT